MWFVMARAFRGWRVVWRVSRWVGLALRLVLEVRVIVYLCVPAPPGDFGKKYSPPLYRHTWGRVRYVYSERAVTVL